MWETLQRIAEHVGLWTFAGGVILLAPVGLLWAPFAAGICGLIALARKREGMAYASAGAKSSATLFLPFFYVLVRALGGSLPVVAVRGTYAFFYAIWVMWVGVQSYFMIEVLGQLLSPRHSLNSDLGLIITLVFSLFVPLSVFLWVFSLKRLLRRTRPAEDDLGSPHRLLPAPAYLEPFAWFLVAALLHFFFLLGYSVTAAAREPY